MAIFRRDRRPKAKKKDRPASQPAPARETGKGVITGKPTARGTVKAKGPKRALTHVGGRVETEGAGEEAAKLAFALEVQPSTDKPDDPTRAHVHGFHSYPARMHPVTAHRLLNAFVPQGGKVLDPFCGSGTVLVEAMLLGMRPAGTDLNPLAVRLAHLKTAPRTDNELEHLIQRAGQVAEFADDRRRAKAGATRRYPVADVAQFEPHVLLELDSLALGIRELGRDHARADLELVLSSLLTRMSRRRGDTSEGTAPRRLAAGFVAKQFFGKARELAGRLREYRVLLPSAAQPAPVVKLADATKVAKLPGAPFEAVICSPPYAATYDYADHHETRMRWLEMDPSEMRRREMGARARYSGLPAAAAAREWMGELRSFLSAMAGQVKPGAPVIVLIADSAVGDTALRAEELVAKAARMCGFKPVARASQARPHFHGPTTAAFRTRPRREHALLLRRE